jgi:hypothetical protein
MTTDGNLPGIMASSVFLLDPRPRKQSCLLKEEADPLAVKLEKQWSGQQKGPRTKLVT